MPAANSFFTSPATGRFYWINEKGVATLADADEQDEYIGCECEIDWRCPHHAGQPTWLETRYDDLAAAEAEYEVRNGWL